MFRASTGLTALLQCLLLTGFASADPNLAYVPKSDPAMSAAFTRAAASLDGFLKAWRDPPPGAKAFAIKIGLADSLSSGPMATPHLRSNGSGSSIFTSMATRSRVLSTTRQRRFAMSHPAR
jgi:hypothetical protein